MSVPYKQQVHDGPRSMETQLFLMTQNAHRLSEVVLQMLDMIHAMQSPSVEELEIGEALQLQMQATNRRILETDIYMSGYQIKEHS